MQTRYIRIDNMTDLDAGHLARLRDQEVVALIIAPTRPRASYEAYCETVRNLAPASDYLWKSDLTVVGNSVGEAHESPELEARYFRNVEATTRLYQTEIFKGPSPVEELMAHIAGLLPGGLAPARIGGKSFLPQIVRRWRQHGGAHPHIDQKRTALLRALGIDVRFGVNTYMNMPPAGGEVEFWRQAMSDEAYERAKRADYGIDRSRIGPADLVYRPDIGETIIFRADALHAVAPINAGAKEVPESHDRITNASFLCLRERGAPAVHFA